MSKTSTHLNELRFPGNYLDIIVRAWSQAGLPTDEIIKIATKQGRVPVSASQPINGEDLLFLFGIAQPFLPQNEPFSLTLSEQFNFTSLGDLGLAVITAENLKHVLDLFVRYHNLYIPGSEVNYWFTGETIHLGINVSDCFAEMQAFLEEVVVAVIVRFSDYFNSNLQPTSVSFAHPNTYPIEAYKNYFKCHVEFNADRTELEFPLMALKASTSMAEANTHAELERKLSAALEQQTKTLSWTEKIRVAWQNSTSAGVTATLEDIANQFNASVRTLERRLEKENTSFRNIVAEARLSQANDLLTNTDIPISVIGFLVGFQDSTSFSRFFKQYMGVSPNHVRAQAEKP
ncbi:MAG: AraC family transcriptional regulator [Pseudomonadales bacterium]|nr:AraC family transcriptional regulator [Pseudomonadales bacterium]